MREVQCSREASRYIEENHDLIPDVWVILFELRDANQPLGEHYGDYYLLETMGHWIYYNWVSEEVKEVVAIKPLP